MASKFMWKGDTVLVITGKDAGKKVVLGVFPKEQRVIVEKVNIVKGTVVLLAACRKVES